MKAKNEKVKKRVGLKKALLAAAALAAAAAIACFAVPAVRRSGAISQTGGEVLNTMRPAALAISYYSSQEISGLAQKPAINADYKTISGLLAQLADQQGYEKIYLLARADGKKLHYLIDGGYRDNGRAGADYYPPSAEYPDENGYKAVKAVAENIYSGKSAGDFAPRLVTSPTVSGNKDVVVACLPVYGAAHAVAAVLCVEADPGDTAYHMIGALNLYYAGLALLLLCGLCVLMLAAGRKLSALRQGRRRNAGADGAGEVEPPEPCGPPFLDDMRSPTEPAVDAPGSQYRSMDDSDTEGGSDDKTV